MKEFIAFPYDQKDEGKKDMRENKGYKIIREYKGEFSIEELLDRIIRSHINK